MTALANPSPVVHEEIEGGGRTCQDKAAEHNEAVEDPIDAWEIFEIIRRIRDPEHPNTLEQLKVVEPSLITVDFSNGRKYVKVMFTPTVPLHCSLTALIGLSISLKLQRSLPQYTKIDVYVTPGTHDQEEQVNKQLNDKERVAAALENKNLLSVVESCMYDYEENC
ncbi:MIP18 family protein F45G2.10-like [Bactrocera neohumeralis]|uniref:MIP18 family protein F45G2.10-like n=1 Tax=Bactrocera neohumeralis TaxID=98809 RepID=UPI0021651D14|nr:MIP18 family protein F45G2.10-like [Bactrocera neohumeralis]